MSIPIRSGKEKFETCKYRSLDIVIKEKQGCCGGTTKTTGYECYKLNKFRIIPAVCQGCMQYEYN